MARRFSPILAACVRRRPHAMSPGRARVTSRKRVEPIVTQARRLIRPNEGVCAMISGRPSNLGTVGGSHVCKASRVSPRNRKAAVVLFPPSRQVAGDRAISPGGWRASAPRPPPIANARGWPTPCFCPSGGARPERARTGRGGRRLSSMKSMAEVKRLPARKGAGLRLLQGSLSGRARHSGLHRIVIRPRPVSRPPRDTPGRRVLEPPGVSGCCSGHEG